MYFEDADGGSEGCAGKGCIWGLLCVRYVRRYVRAMCRYVRLVSDWWVGEWVGR